MYMPTESEIAKYISEVASKLPQTELNVPVTKAQMNICAGSPMPSGWIKVNDNWNPGMCGNPTSIVYNVWTIERYSDYPIGFTMNVCACAPTPAGWVDVNVFWNHWRLTGPGILRKYADFPKEMAVSPQSGIKDLAMIALI